MSETNSEYFTVAKAAEKLQLHPNTIRNLILRGDLKAERIGRSIRIRNENLDALLTPYVGGGQGVWKI